jgi:tRNA pseudouridine-54 N-methylase
MAKLHISPQAQEDINVMRVLYGRRDYMKILFSDTLAGDAAAKE